MAALESLDAFIHFGCWNYDKCGGNNAVTAVTRAVKQETDSHRIKYVIVAGDNYYPIKNKKNGAKEKLINPSMLASGFDCLPDIQTYVLFGNHDLDNSDSLRLYSGDGTVKDMANSPDNSAAEPCTIMNMELSHVKTKPKLIFPPSDIVTHRIDGNTMILMIDTTMYDISDADKDGNMVCYNQYYNESNLVKLIERQNRAIKEILLSYLADHITNIMFVGHHPLLYPKVKKNDNGETDLKISYLRDLALFFKEIYAMYPTRNYFYLCADYHNYQQGTVILGDMHVEQYIVGTGGTKLDDPLTDYLPADGGLTEVIKTINPIQTDDGSAYVIKYEIKAYGYLRVTLADAPIFEFVQVSLSGGTRRKRARKRTRKRIHKR